MDLYTYPVASARPFRVPKTQQNLTVCHDVLFLGFASYGSLVIFAPNILSMSRNFSVNQLLLTLCWQILLEKFCCALALVMNTTVYVEMSREVQGKYLQVWGQCFWGRFLIQFASIGIRGWLFYCFCKDICFQGSKERRVGKVKLKWHRTWCHYWDSAICPKVKLLSSCCKTHF